MKKGHIPIRMCAGCSARKPKGELRRIICSDQGEIEVDATQHLPGRGVYLCSKSCIVKLKKNRRIQRSLHVKPSEEFFERIEREWDQYESTVK